MHREKVLVAALATVIGGMSLAAMANARDVVCTLRPNGNIGFMCDAPACEGANWTDRIFCKDSSGNTFASAFGGVNNGEKFACVNMGPSGPGHDKAFAVVNLYKSDGSFVTGWSDTQNDGSSVCTDVTATGFATASRLELIYDEYD